MRKAAWLSILLMLVACVDDGGDAAIDVRWSVGGTTCNQAGLRTIRVQLLQDRQVIASADAQCTDDGVLLEGVPGGVYTVQVLGFREGAEAADFVGQLAGVEIPKGGRITTPTINLEEAPGAIDLSWRFDTGQLCRFAQISWVQVTIFDERNRQVAGQGLPCDPALPADDQPIPDGAEYLADAEAVVFDNLLSGPHTILVLAYRRAGDDEAQWFGTAEATVQSFQLSPAEVTLTPCDDSPDSLCR